MVSTAQTRVWQQAARIAIEVLQEAPSAKLLRHLLSKCGEDATFARSHARFLHGIAQRADTSLDADLIGHFGAPHLRCLRGQGRSSSTTVSWVKVGDSTAKQGSRRQPS